jgi:hypothetical protein
MPRMPVDMDDPRVFSQQIDPAHARLMTLAETALEAASLARAEEIHRALTELVVETLRNDHASLLAEAIAGVPSPEVARALWRALIAAWSPAWRAKAGVAVSLFALPVVVIAGVQPEAADQPIEPELSGILADPSRLRAILREHGALCGNEAFALGPALVSSDAIDVSRLGELMRSQRLPDASRHALDAPPAAIALQRGQESVHLRFLLGSALAVPDADLLARSDVGSWGLPLARELARQLAAPGISVLALPRAPLSPPSALQQGRAAQREAGAQLFASNAIRRLRATVGEPVAVISAHRCAEAPGGGELRLSLSSPFDPRVAEGFRCPLFPTDRAGEVGAMLCDLLRDCRVADVRLSPGVHADRDPDTGTILLFKPAAEGVEPTLH